MSGFDMAPPAVLLPNNPSAVVPGIAKQLFYILFIMITITFLFCVIVWNERIKNMVSFW